MNPLLQSLLPSWRTSLWLLLSTVLIPAALTISVGILILVFYRAAWDVAFGVLVLCFAVFAVTGSSITVFILRRTARLAQLQAEFIANISHDFRTPLTSIRLFVETLRSGRVQDPAEQEQCLEHLARETERMERLVQQVLTFRRVEQARGLGFEPEAPAELVERALQPFELDEAAAARLELVVEPHLPRVLVDGGAVVDAIRNLVENALKYSTNPGPVVVTLRSDGEAVAISVRDQGPAIPKREQRRIFKRFHRAAGTGKPGSGLGLSIASEIARAHGGRLDLRCSEDMGNVFNLRLPLVVPDANGSAAASAVAGDRTPEG